MKSLEEKMEKLIEGATSTYSDAGGQRDGGKTQSILRNPGLRNLVAYAGDHRLYKKWRSKVKGVLTGESENFKTVLKVLEAPDRTEIQAEADDAEEYRMQVLKMASLMKLDEKEVVGLSQQLYSLLTNHCEDSALAIVDS